MRNRRNFQRALRQAAWAALTSALVVLLPQISRGADPTDPEITVMVDRALKWLERQDDDRLGGKCLIGLAFYKAGRPLTHPKVAAALAACTADIGRADINISGEPLDNYSIGLAIVFLLETNPAQNRALAQRYVGELLKRQKPHGAWGYHYLETGDTSQTQYPALGLWLAVNNGLELPVAAIEKTCAWLLRTQDPSGAWGYQGTDPGRLERVTQSELRPAMVAAGLGSLYVCADMLGLSEADEPEEEAKLPPALVPVGEVKKPKRRRIVSKAIDRKLVQRAVADGDRWMASMPLDPKIYPYLHYYLFALERYHSFRELAERRIDPDPRWYNDAAALLRETQHEDGFWTSDDFDAISTSFAVLMLVRSSRQTIGRVVTDLGRGVLLGGMGLPANTADLREHEGRIIEKPLAGTLDELLALIEKSNLPDLDRLAASAEAVTLDPDVVKRSGQITRLRALVSTDAFEPRLIAVKALARVRELDNVPILIYALTDPDLRIVREADQGLRFISRKFDGVGLPAEPKPADVKAAIAAWKAWYRSIRPNAEFLD